MSHKPHTNEAIVGQNVVLKRQNMPYILEEGVHIKEESDST